MMKNTKYITAIALGSLMSLPAFAGNMSTDYRTRALVEVCKSVQSNKPLKLFNSLEQHRLNVQTINAKLMCNNESVYDFALTHNANRTADVLNRGQVQIKDIAYTGGKINVFVD